MFVSDISKSLNRFQTHVSVQVACVESRLEQLFGFRCQLLVWEVTISGLNISQAGQILKHLCFWCRLKVFRVSFWRLKSFPSALAVSS